MTRRPQASHSQIQRARSLLDEDPRLDSVEFDGLLFVRTSPGHAGRPTVEVRRGHREAQWPPRQGRDATNHREAAGINASVLATEARSWRSTVALAAAALTFALLDVADAIRGRVDA